MLRRETLGGGSWQVKRAWVTSTSSSMTCGSLAACSRTSCDSASYSQSRRGPGPFFGRNSSSSSSSNSSSRSSYSSRSSVSSSSSSSSKSSSRSLSSSKSPNCSSPRLSPRRLSDQSDVSRDNIVTPS